ncbi:MAG: AEC family transporter [Oscillospiraceae bacterium]
MDMGQIINQMIVLFLMMGTGYICGKIGYIDDGFSKKMTNLILMVTTPAMILASVSAGDTSYPKSTAFYVLGIAVATYLLLPILGVILAKVLMVPKEDFKLYVFMTIFSNIGFMGYPVVKTIFGSGAVFLASLFNMVFSIVLYSLGVWLMDKSGTGKFNIKNIISPAMISSVVALIIFVTEWKMPSVLASTFEAIGSMTSPSAMLLIGASLSTMKAKEILGEVRLYPFTVIKQILIPFAVFYLMGFFIADPTILGITTIVIAMPVGTIAVMFSNQYEGNVKLAAKGIFITTICSFVTIPLLCMVM